MITTKYPGKCGKCGASIPAGERVEWDSKTKQIAHGECPGGNSKSVTAQAPRRPAAEIQYEPIPVMPGSEEQEAIYEYFLDGKSHIVVNAGPGVGKTFSMCQCCLREPHEDILFVAFNRHIAAEANGKLIASGCRNARATTAHGLGRKILITAFPALKSTEPDSRKMTKILEKLCPPPEFGGLGDWRRALNLAERLADFAKNYLLDYKAENFRDEIERVADHHGLDMNGVFERAFPLVAPALDECKHQAGTSINFDDMIWLPTVLGLPMPYPPARLIVDESQDLSVDQHELIFRACPTGRIIVVGDRRQAIYSWRGADANSIDTLKDRLAKTKRGVREFPLTITRRCPKSHVALARNLFPGIQALDDAPEGEIREVPYGKAVEGMRVGDMVVCRVNKDLIKCAYDLIRRGVRPVVKGCDVGQGLLALLAKLEKAEYYPEPGAPPQSDLAKLRDKLSAHRREEEGKLFLLGDKGAGRLAALREKCDCLLEFITNSKTVAEMRGRIGTLFSDEEGGFHNAVVLGTVHRCVHPDTLMETADGLLRISDISPDGGSIASPSGQNYYEGKYVKPEGPTLRFITKRGYELEVDPSHGLTVWRDGKHRRVEAKDIRKGDQLRLRLGATYEPPAPFLPPAPGGLDIRAVAYEIPKRMTSELAELLGLLVADGTMYPRGFRVTKRYQSVIDRFASLVKNLFAVDAHVGKTRETRREGAMQVPCGEVNSVQLSQWLLSFGGLAPYAKDIPDLILRSPLEMQRAFLRGLFEDGTVNVKRGRVDHIDWGNMSATCARTVQTMLLRLGIVASRRIHADGHASLYLYSDFAAKFAAEIGFMSDEKNETLKIGRFGEDTTLHIPVTPEELQLMRSHMKDKDFFNARRRLYISRRVASTPALQAFTFLRSRMRWIYQPVEQIETGRSETICVSVPKGNRFLQNGFDGWNTKGLESPRVFVLAPELLPHPMAKKDHEREGERNCAWIAATRAKFTETEPGTLTFCGAIPAIYQPKEEVPVHGSTKTIVDKGTETEDRQPEKTVVDEGTETEDRQPDGSAPRCGGMRRLRGLPYYPGNDPVRKLPDPNREVQAGVSSVDDEPPF